MTNVSELHPKSLHRQAIQSFFYYATGARNTVVNSNGFQTFWSMEIGPREGGGAPAAFPVDYGYKCVSGSGMHGGGGPSALTEDF